MEHLEENIAINPSYEETNGDTIDWNNVTDVNFLICQNSTQYWWMSSYEGYTI
jgi:hypothetical protein